MTEENRDPETEPQGPEQETDAGPAVAEDGDGDAPEETARERFPVQEDVALKYVAENKYAYGPRLSEVDMEWHVTAAAPMAVGIVRVTIEYVPTRSFRGSSGSEYVDVNEDGVVLARRQLRVPKENKPWVLIGIAAISVLAAAALVPFILVRSDAVDPLYVQGRTLWMRAEKPVVQDAIHYVGLDTEGTQHEWAIEPVNAGTDIAVVEVAIINATSGSVRLVVDGKAAELRLRDVNEGVKPVNVIDRAAPTDSYNQGLNFAGFIPIWGSLTLNSNEQIKGHMVFEVPEGAAERGIRWWDVQRRWRCWFWCADEPSIREFRWRATDTMTVRYQ
jgi:hypothetical protein